MQSEEIRKRFLEFFKARGHAVIPSASLVPENDPTTLFTSSGMQPMVPYLLGQEHPLGKRLTDSQKSFRSVDIEEVGDNRHTTFFEMLGNWSLGDYFKEEQLSWLFEFLIDEIGIDPSKLYVSVFIGDSQNSIPRDEESPKIWQKLFKEKSVEAKVVEIGSEKMGGEVGMQGGRIFYYDADKNWWSRSGSPEKMPAGEPGGPDSEIFYEFTNVPHNTKFGEHCHPNCDCGRFLEIGNSVFMEYFKKEDGSFEKLKQKNVDFGGGLERITMAANNLADVFEIDLFNPLMRAIEERAYEFDARSARIIADHLRSSVFLISDGVIPSNTGQGYILRRLIRRAVRHLDKSSFADSKLSELTALITSRYKKTYNELQEKEKEIISVLDEEEEKFEKTLKKGLREFEKISEDKVSGQEAFDLYQSYGFPVELTEELAKERGKEIDTEGFHKLFEEHQDKSRKGAEKKFKGGLGDTSEMSVKYHTATHLLNAALRKVLGEHVEQRGSNITPERLRFDFSHPEKMTDEQKQEVEDLVNQKIEEGLEVSWEEKSVDEARAESALGVFGEKYADVVKVYSVGEFSKEICGGPHVENTKELGKFKIKKEESVSAGVRRIKAILE